jgi:hypothetical protein
MDHCTASASSPQLNNTAHSSILVNKSIISREEQTIDCNNITFSKFKTTIVLFLIRIISVH